MSEEVKEVLASSADPWQKGMKLVDRLFDAGQPSAVYGEPIVDITKIALACATAIGSMLFMLKKMRHASGG